MSNFSTKLEQYSELAQRAAVWKTLQEFLSNFITQDTEEVPGTGMKVDLPGLGSQLVNQEVLQRVESEIEEKLEDLDEQLKTFGI